MIFDQREELLHFQKVVCSYCMSYNMIMVTSIYILLYGINYVLLYKMIRIILGRVSLCGTCEVIDTGTV